LPIPLASTLMSLVGQNPKYSLRADVFRFATNIRHTIGSACSCQQITNRAVVPVSASGSANTSIIQRLRYGAMVGRSSRLYLLDDGKDVGGEGVRCLPVCRYALCLSICEVCSVSQCSALRLLLSQSSSGPVSDQGSLFFGQCGVDVQHERVGVRAQLGDDEWHPLGHQP
jgi:hypothetical protein